MIHAQSTAPIFAGNGKRNQRRSCAENQCRTEPLRDPSADQPGEARREPATDESCRADDQAADKQSGMSPEVSKPAAPKQQTRMRQHITHDHPLDRGDFQREGRRDRRETDIDGAVERSQQRGQTGDDYRIAQQGGTSINWQNRLVGRSSGRSRSWLVIPSDFSHSLKIRRGGASIIEKRGEIQNFVEPEKGAICYAISTSPD